MCDFMEYSDHYSGTGSLWQYHKDEQKNLITDSNLFKVKARFLANTNNRAIINADIAVPLKYLSNFWRTLEMSLINYEISLILTWSPSCAIARVNRETFLTITDTKLYVKVVTLSTNDNIKLLAKEILHNWLFTISSMFQWILLDDSNRFK